MKLRAIRSMPLVFLSGVFLSATLAKVAANAPNATEKSPVARSLLEHRAVYELSLASSTGSKGPNTATGRIAFDFTGNSCDGYVQNFRQFTELQLAEGPAHVSDLRAATFEEGNGKAFRFKLETRIDNSGQDDVDGKAAKSGDGALSVDLSRPRPIKVDLDKDVVFPTDHMRRIIQAAREDKRLLELKVFDGSDTGQKIYDTMTVIGKAATQPAKEKIIEEANMQDVPRWPVSISYFEEGKKDSQPAYVLSFDLYENGVSRALRLDYGDFVLAGEITKLEKLPVSACNQ